MTNLPIIRIVIDTWSSSEDFNGDCDYALVAVDASYVAELLWRMEEVKRLLRADEDFYALEYWDGRPAYFGYNDRWEAVRDFRNREAFKVPRGEPILLTADPGFQEDDFQRVECRTVQVDRNEVWWTAYVKHTNVRIETAPVSKKTLLKIQDRFLEAEGVSPPRKPLPAHPVVRQIHDLLYLDMKNKRFFYNADKAWDSDTLDQIARVVARYIPRPPSVKDER